MIEPATIRNHPESGITLTAAALARGLPLGRPMTRLERQVVAIISAQPTQTLTLHSADKTRSEMAGAFRCVVKRANRRPWRDPMIYVATLARSQTGDGYHVHALLWDYLHAATLGGWCKDLGLGWPKIDYLTYELPGDPHAWTRVTYVLTQHEPAFGTCYHLRHEAVPPYGHRLLYPQRSTLAQHCPDLLSALDMAQDQSVSDETLCSLLPKFSRELTPIYG